jgi:probable HAF family extracellular repeat protein
MRISWFSRISVLLGMASAVALAIGPATNAAGAGSGTAGLAASRSSKPPVPASYRLIDLGTLGGDSSFTQAMNDRGAVVGRAQTADGRYHGFVWRAGTMTDLGLFSPWDINNRGQILGTLDDGSGVYLWSRGVLKPLNGLSFPTAINDCGKVVGLTPVDGRPDRPALWSRGTVRALPLDSVSDINKRGQVSGGRLSGAGFHAAVWHRGRVTDLGAAAFDRGNSYRINDKGWVIGWVFSAQQAERGALWRHGVRTDLGTLGGEATHPVAINDHGVILVTSQIANGYVHPALWQHGKLTDLAGSGLDVNGDVTDFNNRGEIAGAIRLDETAHAVVYRPSHS